MFHETCTRAGLLVATMLVALGVDEARAEGTATVFEAVSVYDVTDGTVLADARVVVVDAKVARVESMSEGQTPANAVVIDAIGKTLMPGLADMHVHYWPEVGPMFVANGVTTVRNLWGNVSSAGWDKSAKSGALVVPHHYYSGPLMDGPEPIWGDQSIRITSAAEAVGAIEAQRSAGFKAVKLYEGLTPEIFGAAVTAAKARELQVWAHTPTGMTYEDVVALGVDSIEHLNNAQDILLPDGMEIQPGEGRYLRSWSLAAPAKIERLAEKVAAAGVWNAPTYMVTMKQYEFGADPKVFFARPEAVYLGPGLEGWWRNASQRESYRSEHLAEASANYRAMIKALYDAGAPLLVGTDTPNPFTIPGFAIHDEIAAFVESGSPTVDVLRIATAEAARFLGEAGQWGVVAEGARADLVLLDDHPVENLATLRDPVGVMVNGNWHDRAALGAALAGIREAAEQSRREEAAKKSEPAEDDESP